MLIALYTVFGVATRVNGTNYQGEIQINNNILFETYANKSDLPKHIRFFYLRLFKQLLWEPIYFFVDLTHFKLDEFMVFYKANSHFPLDLIVNKYYLKFYYYHVYSNHVANWKSQHLTQRGFLRLFQLKIKLL